MLIQANATQIPLADKSVQLCAFSPPYWGLRKYSIFPLVWGDSKCEHVWGGERFKKSTKDTASGLIDYRGPAGPKQNNPRQGNEYTASQGQFCQRCGAWRGDLGLEPTPELYLDHMMLVMAEVCSVLGDKNYDHGNPRTEIFIGRM